MSSPHGAPSPASTRHRAFGARLVSGLAAVLAIVTLGAGFATTAFAFDMKSLMAQLAQTREGKASFTEERHVNGFDSPMRTSGELYFKAPDVFERRTLSPARESMLVNGNQMTLARGSAKRSMALDAAPEAAAIVGAIRGTLTGDASTLERHFKVGLSGKADDWLLDLQPLDAQLQANVRNVQLRGKAGVVTGVEIWFASGDRSVMTIRPTAD
jgi:outer membrane lipoprotein-sorting protein